MRKALIVFLAFFITAVSGTCYVHTMLLNERDQVLLTETAVYGDKSVVEGVTIERKTKYDKFIRWNTTYEAGEEPVCKTEYNFDEYGRFQDEGTYEPSGIELHTNPIVNFDDEDKALELVGLDKAMRELLDETEPGQESSRIFDLTEYLDYYIYDINIDLPGDIHHYFMNESDIKESLLYYKSNHSYMKDLEDELHLVQALTEFFKIPVIENHLYEISVSKDMDGNLFGWGYSNALGGGSTGGVAVGNSTIDEADAFDLYMFSAYAKDKCYFTFNTRTYQDNIVDTSHIPGGYGIYCLPFDEEKKTIDIDSLQMVYALEPEDYVISLEYDEKRNQLLLFSKQETGCVMTVIDAATMEQKQELCYYSEMYGAYGIYFGEDFVVLRYESNKGVVLSIDENGKYELEMRFDISELVDKEELYHLDSNRMSVDWNGEMLIIGDSLDGENYFYNQSCGFYLAVFDKNGLVYYGEYESSLDTGKSYNDYYFNCMPIDTGSLKISWQD